MRRLLLAVIAAIGFALPAHAQDHFFPTPGNATVEGQVMMCLNAQGQAEPATAAGTCIGGGGGGGGSVTQGTSPWVISGAVTQGTSPWVTSGAVTQGTSPWVVSGATTVTQTTSPWIIDETNSGQLHTDLTGPVPCLNATTPTTNSYTTGQTNPVNCNLNGGLYVALTPQTAGGVTTFFLQPTASDNHTNIKNGAGQVYWVLAENNSGTVNYLRFYNAATGFNGCNSATNLISQIQIPASTAVGGVNISLPYGIPFSTGISICVTSGYATTDTANATATAISLTVGYN